MIYYCIPFKREIHIMIDGKEVEKLIEKWLIRKNWWWKKQKEAIIRKDREDRIYCMGQREVIQQFIQDLTALLEKGKGEGDGIV